MILNESIEIIVNLYFQTRNIKFEDSQIGDTQTLIEQGVIETFDDKYSTINFNSKVLMRTLCEIVEREINEKLSHDIDDVFKQIERFESVQKEKFNNSNLLNAYSELFDALKSYIFYSYHIEEIVDIFCFYKSLPKKKQHYYDKYILSTILVLDNIEELVVYEILSILKSNDKITCISDYCKKIGRRRPRLAQKLYSYSLQQNNANDFYILSNILLGLYEVDEEITFIKVKELLNYDNILMYFTLGRLKYSKLEHITKCFEIIKSVDLENPNELLQIPYIYQALIKNENTSKEIRAEIFVLINDLFSIESEQLRDELFRSCSFIDGYERERYELYINTFLSKSSNYINKNYDFFSSYMNSDYFFDFFTGLYITNYNENGFRFNTNVIIESLSHFWDNDRDRTEQHLLDLISHEIPALRIGAVDLIHCKAYNPCDISLKKLGSEQKQLRALEALFFHIYINIDNTLALVLSLYKSEYENVVIYLQEQISILIFEAYQEYIYDKIVEIVKDDEFLKPLKDTLNQYKEIKLSKSSINDLNPNENERDLMELYYSLEHEGQRKLMDSIRSGEDSFLTL